MPWTAAKSVFKSREETECAWKWSNILWAREASQGKKDRKPAREPRSYMVWVII